MPTPWPGCKGRAGTTGGVDAPHHTMEKGPMGAWVSAPRCQIQPWAGILLHTTLQPLPRCWPRWLSTPAVQRVPGVWISLSSHRQLSHAAASDTAPRGITRAHYQGGSLASSGPPISSNNTTAQSLSHFYLHNCTARFPMTLERGGSETLISHIHELNNSSGKEEKTQRVAIGFCRGTCDNSNYWQLR